MKLRNHFFGRVAKNIVMQGDVAKMVLLRNEYAGKDESEQPKERLVSIQFTAFGHRAKALFEHVKVGDQLLIEYRIENNDYGEGADRVYSYNFIVEDFEFGAKGSQHVSQS